ncbi:MAG: tRNA threonylcarbamoyladenosine dehydratase [Myxococcales bacterium]|nr:tRNA threonylcarbamoyladenosine dehydratase [Myxococcales bacterium]
MTSVLDALVPPLAAPAVVPASVPTPRSRSAQRRFDRLVRLVREEGFDRLQRAHVMVFGLGGVGGFAAEGLARSGIGRITLVDFDVVCATNVNRQLQALHGTVGAPKADLLAARLRLVNPQARIEAVRDFFGARNAADLLPAAAAPDWVIDAIDHRESKALLLDRCRLLGVPVVSSMGAAGKLDPTLVRIGDLAESNTDPFARSLRKRLRQRHGWPAGRLRGPSPKTGVTVVYSLESRRHPIAPSWDGPAGFQCICPADEFEVDLCAHRAQIEGSAVFVTSVFGMAAASVVVRGIVAECAAPTLDEDDARQRQARQGAPAERQS